MNLVKIASRLAIEYRLAFEMNESEWKEYQKEHPKADRRNHKITKDPTDKKPSSEPTIVPKHKINLSKEKLKETLSKGHYTIISAGRNPNDKEESELKPDDAIFHKRHLQLQAALEEMGVPYTEVVGHYGGKESTFLILHDDTGLTEKTDKSFMVHHAGDEAKINNVKKVLDELAKRFNQDSVLHGDEGRNDLHFTTGKHQGETCGGKGWEEAETAKDIYTDIELENHEHTKFRTNIDECFEKGLL